ncbi:uncharacterized protein LOC105217797 [Zeugodacus cucurbitae]|uniref:uncharacterized protein LOC105217797 n=1 Tax=Zeugodacus cucurbitae TaxID=28588 RepID=UPI0023D8EC4D|nr:uncharacterized protein LOC105217797 [Zeugodacus cucurbitae]
MALTSRTKPLSITPFVAVGMLMFMLVLGNAIVVFMKYKNNNNGDASVSSLEYTSGNNNQVKTQLTGAVEITLLTNELATTISANRGINNKNNTYNIYSYEQQQLDEINAAVKHSTDTMATLRQNSNNNNLLHTLPLTSHKRFDDEINISNQRHELNGHPTADEVDKMPAATSESHSSTDNPVAEALIKPVAAERGEGAGVQYTPLQQQENQEGRGNLANTELLLHRQKRYLVFPEGSSFQLVFDLIIGIVDYTSYAILGITCAVAWELPSKPPSELIENLHDKISEGIYPTSGTKPSTTATMTAAMRRNDSVGNANEYGLDAAGIKYVDNSNVAAYSSSKYENSLQQPIATVGLAQSPQPHEISPLIAYETAHQPNLFAVPTTSYSSYHKEMPDAHDDIANSAYRPINYYANIHSDYKSSNNKYYHPTHKYGSADKNAKSSYYGVSDSYNKNPFGNTAHRDSTDKLPVNFANRWQQQQHQQPQYKKWQSWQDYDSNWQSYQQPQQKHTKWAQRQQQQKWSTQSKYVGKDNWWSRNKPHVTDSWRTKQADGSTNRVRNPGVPMQPRQPVLTYAPASASPKQTEATDNSNADTVESRNFDEAQRRLLTTRPKPRIYPVFGRRRRRRRSVDAEFGDFEYKLEHIHLREQLRSRQKLYGKIEKLYETRGMNGSACVLRALCETGQQQQNYEEDTAEPQSFITELLRAIFVLPTTGARTGLDNTVNAEEPALHPTDLQIIERPYREAQAHRGSCSQLFTMCEHSIWE